MSWREEIEAAIEATINSMKKMNYEAFEYLDIPDIDQAQKHLERAKEERENEKG